MFCKFCGFENSIDSNFCKNCGKQISEVASIDKDNEIPQKKLKRFSTFLANNPSASKYIAFITILYICIIWAGFYGVRITKSQEIGSVLLIFCGSFAYIWKKAKKNPWIGAVIGFFVTFFVMSISATADGYVNARKNWKTNFIESCTNGQGQMQRDFCSCVAEKSTPKMTIEEIKEKSVPLCKK